jgi:hypothetical protein
MKRLFQLSLIASVFVIAMSSTAASPELKEIMQGLRDNTVEIADGLFTDDFERVALGAAGIANHAQIPPEQVQLVAAELGAEMPTFKQFDISVHDLSLSIAAAAEKQDRDQASADFHRMLDGCLACHAAYKHRIAAVLRPEA